MKILHITNAYPYDGYQSFGIFIKEQIDSLSSIGLINNVFFINARKNGFKEYFKQVNNLKNIIRDYNPDIIHCHHEFSLIPLSLLRIDKPIILSLLGDIEKRSNINKLIYKVLKGNVKRIILKNKNIHNSLYSYIPNGVDIDFFKQMDKSEAKRKASLNEKTKYILFVTASLNNPIKRFDKFQEVLNNINKRLQNNYEPLILSGVKREMVPAYFNSAEFLLLTSDHEGSPNAVKEAMACDLPIVSTNVGNVKQLFANSYGNFIANSGSIDELLQLSLIALECTKSNGRERLINLELSMNSVAKKLYSLYQELT